MFFKLKKWVTRAKFFSISWKLQGTLKHIFNLFKLFKSFSFEKCASFVFKSSCRTSRKMYDDCFALINSIWPKIPKKRRTLSLSFLWKQKRGNLNGFSLRYLDSLTRCCNFRSMRDWKRITNVTRPLTANILYYFRSPWNDPDHFIQRQSCLNTFAAVFG